MSNRKHMSHILAQHMLPVEDTSTMVFHFYNKVHVRGLLATVVSCSYCPATCAGLQRRTFPKRGDTRLVDYYVAVGTRVFLRVCCCVCPQSLEERIGRRYFRHRPDVGYAHLPSARTVQQQQLERQKETVVLVRAWWDPLTAAHVLQHGDPAAAECLSR